MQAMAKRLFLILTVLVLVACGEVKITAPANNAVTPTPPDVTLTFAKGSPTGLKITLNSRDVTSLFTVSSTGATATGASLKSNLFPGKNLLVVTAVGVAKQQVVFNYDIEGPAVHITNGNRTAGTVTGYLEDVGGVKSLTIDGAVITLGTGNSFSVQVANNPITKIVTVDNFGNSSTLELARRDREFLPAISARLNNTGLAFLGDVLEEALGKVNFQALMQKLNPILSLTFFGLADMRVDVQDLAFSKPTIDLAVLDNERLQTHAVIPNFSIGIKVSGRTGVCPFCLPWTAGGTLYMNKVNLDTDILLNIVNKDLAIDLNNTRAFLDVNRLDINGLPNILGIENLAGQIVGGLVNVLMPFFTGVIDGVVGPVVSDFIGEIPVNLTLTTVEGEKLKIKALPQYLDTFDNSLTIDLGASVIAPEPSAAAVPAWGSVYTAGDTPTIGATTKSGKPFDIGAAISANLINQALFAAHESGITTMTIRPDNTPGANPQGVSVIKGTGDDIQQTDVIGMRIEPKSAPFISLMDMGGAFGRLSWYDVKLSFDLKRAGWAEYQQVFSATFSLDVPFQLGATDDGYLQLGLEQLPTINVSATEYKGLIPLTPRFINGILERFMPLVLPRIAEQLKAIPLPKIAGYGLYPTEFWISGTGKNNLSLAGRLVKVSTTQAAPAPTSLLAFVPGTQVVSASTATTTTARAVTASTTVAQPAITVENGTVTVNVDGQNPSLLVGGLEYRFRVDGGPWSIWKARSKIELTNLLGGDHSVEVCSRTALLKQEQGCPTVAFTTAVVQ